MNDEVKKAIQELGRQGGNKTKEKYGTKHFSDAGKAGSAKRWANHTKKTKLSSGKPKTAVAK